MEGGRESIILHHPQKDKPATLRRPPSQYPIPFPTVDPDDPPQPQDATVERVSPRQPQDATEERAPPRREEVVASSPVRQPQPQQQAPQPTSALEIPSDVQKIKKPEPEPEETRIEVKSVGTTAPKIKPTSTTKPQKSTSYLPIAVIGFVVAGAAACAYYVFTF